MNYSRIALAGLGATVAYVALGFLLFALLPLADEVREAVSIALRNAAASPADADEYFHVPVSGPRAEAGSVRHTARATCSHSCD